MPDTNLTSLAYVQEAVFGVTPAAANLKLMRFTSESLQHGKDVIESNEIRPDRQRVDLIKVGSNAAGGINFELSLVDHLPFLLAALGQTAWVTWDQTDDGGFNSTQQTFDPDGPFAGFIEAGFFKVSGSAVVGNNGIKRISSVDAFDVITCPAGSFTGTGTETNIRVYRISATNGDAIPTFTFEREVDFGADMGYQSYDGMAINTWSLNVVSKQIVTGEYGFIGRVSSAGTVSRSTAGLTAATGLLTLTANPIADQTVTIGVGTGSKVYTFKASVTTVANQVKIGASASVTIDNLIAAINGGDGGGSLYGSLTVAHTQVTAAVGAGDTMGLTARLDTEDGAFGNTIELFDTLVNGYWSDDTLSGGVNRTAYVEVGTDPVVDGTNDLTGIWKGAEDFTDRVKSISFTVNNNLRTKDALGVEGSFELGTGVFAVTGSIEAYFESMELYNELINHEATSIAFLMTDANGKVMGVTFPRVKFSNGNPNVEGNNQDMMLKIDFTAMRDPGSGKTIIIDRFQ